MALNHGYTYSKRLGSNAAGLTLLDFLTATYRHSSVRDWQARIEDGRVRLDGVAAEPTAVLRSGQTLTWHRPPWTEPDAPTGFAVLYADSDLLAVAKPRGLPSMPGGGFLTRTLLYLVRQQHPGSTPLHRLGRGTSGLMLFARSDRCRPSMTEAWRRGEVVRHYRALVRGRPEPDELDIRAPIGPVFHPLLGRVYAATERGKPSRSRARVLERRSKTSLLEVEIETGRPHQIRIHLAFAGFPLLGDRLYPTGGVPAPDTEALPGDPGYFLHAERIRFRHPGSGRSVEIECAPPRLLRTTV